METILVSGFYNIAGSVHIAQRGQEKNGMTPIQIIFEQGKYPFGLPFNSSKIFLVENFF